MYCNILMDNDFFMLKNGGALGSRGLFSDSDCGKHTWLPQSRISKCLSIQLTDLGTKIFCRMNLHFVNLQPPFQLFPTCLNFWKARDASWHFSSFQSCMFLSFSFLIDWLSLYIVLRYFYYLFILSILSTSGLIRACQIMMGFGYTSRYVRT